MVNPLEDEDRREEARVTFDEWARREVAIARDVAGAQGFPSAHAAMLWCMPRAVSTALELFPGADIHGVLMALAYFACRDDNSPAGEERRQADQSFDDWSRARVRDARSLADEQGISAELAMARTVHLYVAEIHSGFPDRDLAGVIYELGRLARAADAERGSR